MLLTLLFISAGMWSIGNHSLWSEHAAWNTIVFNPMLPALTSLLRLFQLTCQLVFRTLSYQVMITVVLSSTEFVRLNFPPTAKSIEKFALIRVVNWIELPLQCLLCEQMPQDRFRHLIGTVTKALYDTIQSFKIEERLFRNWSVKVDKVSQMFERL